jgi:hypothetical protein
MPTKQAPDGARPYIEAALLGYNVPPKVVDEIAGRLEDAENTAADSLAELHTAHGLLDAHLAAVRRE